MRFTRILLLVSLAALVAAPVALALRFTDESFNPPVGETGKAYSWSFTGAGGCGPALPYQYRLLGSTMPPGLTLDSSGLVHGIPTSAGDYSVWVELSDQDPPSAAWCTTVGKAQREFKFKIIQGLTIDQRQSSLGAIFLNQPWAGLQLTAKGESALGGPSAHREGRWDADVVDRFGDPAHRNHHQSEHGPPLRDASADR